MLNEDFLKRIELIGACAYSTRETLLESYRLTEYCLKNDITGDFVECGIGAGSQIAMFGLALERFQVHRTVWAFDSYEGIPLASEEDEQQPGIGDFNHDTGDKQALLVSSGITVHSLENVQSNLSRWGIDFSNWKFVKGWFQHTLPEVSQDIENIAILRLDGDLYESTKVCLEFLFNKLVSGGVLIVDDYALSGARKAVHKYINDFSMFSKQYQIENSTPMVFIT
jgi:hypothetical protein